MTQQTPLGFTFAGVHCGLKQDDALDLALVVSDRPCVAAATFTRNRFAAAPVIYDRALLAENPTGLRAVAINAGIANACTGEAGLADATSVALAAESALSLPPRSCAVMSTGVIGPRLPVAKIEAGIRQAATGLAPDGWDAASHAIMTTDVRPKTAFRQVTGCTLFGMAKGSGMIHPNMATMLAVIVTDAAVNADALAQMTRAAVDVSFNAISVDGDTSTNDTVLVLANGAAGDPDLRGFENLEGLAAFASALTDLCVDLAQQVVRGGEGATKFITVRVEGAASDADARLAAKAVANSPLVKTAFYGGDANWGRILAAVGYSGARVDPARADLWVAAGRGEASAAGDHGGPPLQLVRAGQPLDYSEETATAIFAGPEITVTVNLGLGDGETTVWTCDLSHEYVTINGHYRT